MANVCIAIALKLTATLKCICKREEERKDFLITMYMYQFIKLPSAKTLYLRRMKSFLRSAVYLATNCMELKLSTMHYQTNRM
jgi:hypothetical protein